MPQSHTTDQPMARRGKVKERYQRHDTHSTIMIAKLERTRSTTEQNKELTLNPHKQLEH